VICSGCGHDNRAGARFCDGCGARLGARCPACDTELRPGARFCDACGRALAAPPGPPGEVPAPLAYTPRHLAERILTQGRAIHGQRKDVTVLFVDVQGSTELAGSLDPEDFHAVLDGAFRIMLDAVHRWEGTVNQFTGDGIMALFGAPLAHEDHARRACHTALEIQRGFATYAASLRQETGLSFQARVGLNSGQVIVGAIGDDLRMDYTAQGLTTNLAARMQQAADPGSILVAAPTYHLAEGYFRFRPLGPIRVRGVAEPIEAYALEAEGTVLSRLEASLRRGTSPFRGRERELSWLAGCWEDARCGRGQAVCVVGEPGIGKSRLAYEFQRSLGLDERAEAAAMAHAREDAFYVFRQLLRSLARIDPDADLAAVRDTLHRRLWDLSPELGARTPDILPLLGAVPDPGGRRGRPEDRKGRLREAVVAWLAAECRRGPRVLVIEDLQWLDPSSEELLGHLAVDIAQMPLLMLMTSRLPLAGGNLELARIREIPLCALSDEDVRAVIDAQVDPYPTGERLQRVVAARSEGNPFYVEELVRAFRERDCLVLEHGSYELREESEGLVPATISALIASRIDRLPASARELLADAAVLGVHFRAAHLRAMAGGEHFDEDLMIVERRGLVSGQTPGGVAEFVFGHVLTQEVIYGGLLQSDRQTRHRRAAETLERLYAGHREDVADQLAYQWTRSDRRARAYPYLLATAERAAAVAANREAIGHLQSALDLATKYPGTAEPTDIQHLRLKLAGLHFLVGER
jgi:class 3 adenylate cyclase